MLSPPFSMLCSGRLKGRLQKLLLLEALAVGALHLGGVGLMGAHGDGVQTAVVLVLAVVGAVGDTAFDGGVRGAVAAVVGTVLAHDTFLQKNRVRRKA
jgi:hypothetical protein